MKYIHSYSEIEKKTSLKNIVRYGILSLLSFTNVFRKIKPGYYFIYIHHVFEDETDKLTWFINFLKKNGQIYTFSQAITALKQNHTTQSPIFVLSSDDGFKNNVNAAEVCKEQQVSMCFFINPELINETRAQILETHCKNKLHLPPVTMLNSNDIAQMIDKNMEFGFHTMNHKRVSEMSAEEFENECKLGKSFFNKMGIDSIHFAFPYGLKSDFGKKYSSIASRYFESVCSAVRGYHNTKMLNNTIIHREHIVLSWPKNHIIFFLKNSKLRYGNWYD